jgi:hypothetical protein
MAGPKIAAGFACLLAMLCFAGCGSDLATASKLAVSKLSVAFSAPCPGQHTTHQRIEIRGPDGHLVRVVSVKLPGTLAVSIPPGQYTVLGPYGKDGVTVHPHGTASYAVGPVCALN